jgi:hypothetical protein
MLEVVLIASVLDFQCVVLKTDEFLADVACARFSPKLCYKALRQFAEKIFGGFGLLIVKFSRYQYKETASPRCPSADNWLM